MTKQNMWWVALVHNETGVVKPRPVFLVKAETHEQAVVEIEEYLDREEYPIEWTLQAQFVEYGEMGPNVAYI